MLYDHDIGIGDINAYFQDCRGYQDIKLMFFKLFHDLITLLTLHLTMHQFPPPHILAVG